MNQPTKVSQFSSFIFNLGALISGFILIVMMISIMIEVLLRHSPVALFDFSGYATVRLIFPLLIFPGLGYTWGNKSHVRVETLLEKLPENFQKIINLITYSGILLILGVITWVGVEEAHFSYSTMEQDIDMAVSLFYFKAFIPIGTTIMGFAVALDWLQILGSINVGRKKQDL